VSDVSDVSGMPPDVRDMRECGYAIWAGDTVAPALRARFDASRIRVLGIRQVRVWGLQVDDERELPGHERTMIPDEELWQVELQATDGSSYEFNSALLVPAPG